jgi:hypothetical protein
LAATIPLLSVWQAPSLDSSFAQAVTIEGWEPEEESLVVAGIRVPVPMPALSVTRRTAGRLPETMGIGTMGSTSVRLVSERIRGVLLRAMGEQVQFLAASITGCPDPYYVPNVLELRSCRIGLEGQLALSDLELPPLFRARELPSVWIVRADLERRLHSESAGEFVPLHQFRLASSPRYRALTEDGWQ